MRTAMLLTPSEEEVLLQAAKIGLPEREARKFFNYYESNGWKVGRVKMVSFTNALAGWKLRYEERVGVAGQTASSEQQSATGIRAVLLGKELDRVLDKMRSIRSTYGDHQTWREVDVKEFKQLRARRDELKKELGIKM